jgi:uncharacterized protein
MAHQCLQCGQSFPDGSTELLKGCPSCQGTRFYYTQSPLAKQERDALMKEANKDIKAILEELVKGHGGPARPAYEDPLWSAQAREKWLQVDARKLRAHEADAVQEVQPPALPPQQARIDAPLPAPKAAPKPAKAKAEQAHLPIEPDRPRPTQTTPALDDSEPREAKPEVVVVEEPGRYDIDVEQLLDKQPIVVRRDGVYVVHLPSVFATAGKR